MKHDDKNNEQPAPILHETPKPVLHDHRHSPRKGEDKGGPRTTGLYRSLKRGYDQERQQ